MSTADPESQTFERVFDQAYQEKMPDFDAHVNIALVGKVSAGKSSLLNALFLCSRQDPIAEVGPRSGVTTKIIPYKFEDDVLVIDCPGLDDLRTENSNETKAFLESIDLGVFVVTGSADATQKANFDTLRANSKDCVVVLNKIDEWDDLEDSARVAVVDQWKGALGVDNIYETCTKGYDPAMRQSAPMDIRGVDELRDHLLRFLKREKKDILFARYLKSKETYATSIIVSALLLVAAEAFVPGSAAYITATQIVSVTSLNYLYTGEVLSKWSVLRMLPSLAGESLGTTAFLWAKSFLPPTLVLDIAAAGIAVLITFAMLAAVKWLLENGHTLTEREEMKRAFRFFKHAGIDLQGLSLGNLKSREFLLAHVGRLLKRTASNLT